jgi:hypothetical protein
MKFKNIKIAFLGLLAMAAAGCETLPDQEVEVTPVYPIAGEWLVHVKQADGTYFGGDATHPTGTLFALRTYNTADYSSTQAWMKMGTTQAPALLGKVTVNVGALTISGENIPNTVNANKAGKTFTIQEGKVMLGVSKMPSGVMADSIYVRYSSTFDNKVYEVMGHRRTQWTDDEF